MTPPQTPECCWCNKTARYRLHDADGRHDYACYKHMVKWSHTYNHITVMFD